VGVVYLDAVLKMFISSHSSRSSRPGSKPAEGTARENDYLKCACGAEVALQLLLWRIPGLQASKCFSTPHLPLSPKTLHRPYSRITDSLSIVPLRRNIFQPIPHPRWRSNILHKALAITNVMSDAVTSEASQKIHVVPGILGHIFFSRMELHSMTQC
jgi:hypothetical protein